MGVQSCRVCLQKGNFESIFRVTRSLMLSTKIMSLANVAIYPNDGLPSTICLPCTDRLEQCIEFVEQCEKSDFHLRSNYNGIDNLNRHNIKYHSEIDIEISENEMRADNPNHLKKDSPRSDVDQNLYIDTDLNADAKSVHSISIKNKDEKCLSKSDSDNIVKSESKKSQKQQCFTCGKVMSSRFRLKTHLRTHTGERPFSCPHCNKNFSLSQNLKVHLRIHTGEKPFSCTICGEAFAHSAGLAVHKRKHTGQKPYQCILCPLNFRTVGHLQYHIRRHTGAKNFECFTCGRAFITRSDLKQHLVTHSDEKPHVCCICGMRLTRASHLKRHIHFIHENNKHSPSDLCSKQGKSNKNKKPDNTPVNLEKT